jgi:hypothetical protein
MDDKMTKEMEIELSNGREEKEDELFKPNR